MACACYGCPKKTANPDDAQVLVLDVGEPIRRFRHDLVHSELSGVASEAHPGNFERPRTPRQLYLQDWLELPATDTLPVPPNCRPDEPLEVRERKLRDMYKDFAIDFHTGVYMTMLKSAAEYSHTHCQLMDDMMTLKLDQRNGRIIEFPLKSVTKVYQMIKLGDECRGPRLDDSAKPPESEEVVVMEFVRRRFFKLAFVFLDGHDAQRFQICMGLLVRRAKQTGPGGERASHSEPDSEAKLLDWALEFSSSLPPRLMPCADCTTQRCHGDADASEGHLQSAFSV